MQVMTRDPETRCTMWLLKSFDIALVIHAPTVFFYVDGFHFVEGRGVTGTTPT